MSRLKIGLIAPPWFAVPPAGYGGIEWVVSLLAEGLVQRGHDVTLFASGGSVTSARLVSTYDRPPSESLGDWPVEAVAVMDAYRQRARFDVLHDHTVLGLPQGSLAGMPIVHTAHGVVTPAVARIYERAGTNVHMVAISESQGASFPAACHPTVIYNGIELSRFPFEARPRDHLLFVGRISEEKGVLQAIEIARRAGKQLIILGKVNEPAERAFFEERLRPVLDPGVVTYIEQPPHEVKVRMYQEALATLFPIQWEEPFGLVMAESMACGTPVIAFRRGSVPEVILDGVTGVVCDTVDEAVAAVPGIRTLSREACRAHVEENFSAEAMVTRYEELYFRVARGQRAQGPAAAILYGTEAAVRAPGP